MKQQKSYWHWVVGGWSLVIGQWRFKQCGWRKKRDPSSFWLKAPRPKAQMPNIKAGKTMDVRKKIGLALLVVSIFIFLVTVLVFVYVLSSKGEQVPPLFRPFLEYHIHFMVVMGFFGVASGLTLYKILDATLEKQKSLAKSNTEIIMRFLSPEDREVLGLLTAKDGMTTQSEIAKLPGMSRLKAHRLVKKLEGRGIIHIEKYGKVNMVRLTEELKN